jgi:hypothetical protein
VGSEVLKHDKLRPTANLGVPIGIKGPTAAQRNHFRIPHKQIPSDPRAVEQVLADYQQVDKSPSRRRIQVSDKLLRRLEYPLPGHSIPASGSWVFCLPFQSMIRILLKAFS